MYQKYNNRYEAYYRHEYLTEFAEEVGGIDVARHFILRAGLPKLPYSCEQHEWDRDIVVEAACIVVQISDKHGRLNEEQIGRLFNYLRGVA